MLKYLNISTNAKRRLKEEECPLGKKKKKKENVDRRWVPWPSLSYELYTGSYVEKKIDPVTGKVKKITWWL